MRLEPRDVSLVQLPQRPRDWAEVRARRAALLAASDWTQTLDAPLTDAQRAAWAAYRQALRDITASAEAPSAVAWPSPPGDLT